MSLLRALLYLSIWTLAVLKLSAQVDTNYIQRFPDKLVWSPFLSSMNNTILMKSYPHFAGDSTQSISYSPNLRGGYGVAFSYRIVDFSIGFRTKIDEESEKKYGKSTKLGLNFRLWISRKLLTEFNLLAVSGFSNLSTTSYDTSKIGQEYPYEHRPDMFITYIKLRGVYQFNPDRFSYRSSFSFSERQKKSAAGFLLNSHMYLHTITGDSAFIPQAVRGMYGDLGNISNLSVLGMGLAPGVGGTWTKGRWFLTGVLFLGLDLQRFAYSTPGNHDFLTENKLATMADFRVSFGYNAPRFFCGFQSITDYNLLRPSAFKINSSFNHVQFVMGWRLHSPKILDKMYNKSVKTFIPKRYRHYMY